MIKVNTLFWLVMSVSSLLWSGGATAGTVCSENYTDALAAQGNVVYSVEENSSCGTNTLYRYTKASTSFSAIACQAASFSGKPSLPNALKNMGLAVRAIVSDGNCNKSTGSTGVAYLFTSSTGWVCDSEIPIKDGYVITRKDMLSDCNHFTGNSGQGLYIQQPANTTVCSESPLPAGYVITGREDTFANCSTGTSTGGGHAYTIRVATYSFHDVCDGSPLPAGYVITARKIVNSCIATGYTGIGFRIEKVTGNGPYTLCDTVGGYQAIPSGYVVLERDNYSNCGTTGFSGAGYKIQLASSISGNIIVCDPSPLPSGYVISEKGSYLQCASSGSRPGFRIQLPQNNLIVCDGTPVPAGWGFTASGTYSQCNNGYGFKLGVIQHGTVICPGNGTTVPAGFVVSNISNYSQCTVSPGLGYTVSAASDGVISCNTSSSSYNVPAGYVVYESNNYSQCGLYGGNKIKLAVNGDYVCSGSPVPTGFAVGAITSSTSCGLTGSMFQLLQITGVGPYTVCSGTVVPTGYVVVENGTYSQCSSVFNSGFVIKLPSATGEQVCDGTTIPEGFVISSYNDYSACNTSLVDYIIKLPEDSGQTLTCSTVIPAGYVIVGTTNGTQCNGQTIYVIEASNAGLIATPFIHAEPDVSASDITPEPCQVNSAPINAGLVVSAVQNSASCP